MTPPPFRVGEFYLPYQTITFTKDGCCPARFKRKIMPRIEYTHPERRSNAVDGSHTFDVCKSCLSHFEEGEQMPEFTCEEGVVSVTDVEHPPFEDDLYRCAVCSEFLDSKDN